MPKYYWWLIGLAGTVFAVVIFILVITTLWHPAQHSPRLHAQELVWTGSAGDGRWENAENWNPATVPTIHDRVTIDNAAVTIAAGQTASFEALHIGAGGITSVIVEGDIQGRDITVSAQGTLVQKNNRLQTLAGTLWIENGGVVTHAPNLSSLEFSVKLAADNIRLDAGGEIRVDSLGYGAGNGPGTGMNSPSGAGGGGYGGKGGDGTGGTGGSSYCIADQDIMIGSGGGNGAEEGRGAGGGLIVLKAFHTLTLNGRLSARGSTGGTNNAGGGAGGGIALVARTISGTPQEIVVDGGNGDGQGGGGGGGCMVVKYVEENSLTSEMIHRQGGISNLVTSPEVSSSSSSSSGVPTVETPTTTVTESTSSSSVSNTNALMPQQGGSAEEGKVFFIQIEASSPELPTLPVFSTTTTVESTLGGSSVNTSSILYTLEQTTGEEMYDVVSSTAERPQYYTFTELASSTRYFFRLRQGGIVKATSTFQTSSTSLRYTWIIPTDETTTSTLPDILKLDTSTSTVTSTRVLATTTLPLITVLQANSKVVITALPKTSAFTPGDLIKYAYDYRNTFPEKQRFKVVRQLVEESTGKVVINKSSNLTLRSNQNFSFNVSERLPFSLKTGVFLARVLVFDDKGMQLEGNGFRFIVQEK